MVSRQPIPRRGPLTSPAAGPTGQCTEGRIGRSVRGDGSPTGGWGCHGTFFHNRGVHRSGRRKGGSGPGRTGSTAATPVFFESSGKRWLRILAGLVLVLLLLAGSFAWVVPQALKGRMVGWYKPERTNSVLDLTSLEAKAGRL